MSNPTIETTEIEATIATGMMVGEPKRIHPDDRYAVVPRNAEIQSIEEFHPRPYRIRRLVQLYDCDSFIEYIETFKDPKSTRIFFNAEKETFFAVLDYHVDSATPAWCNHAAKLHCRRTTEFSTWMGLNHKAVPQVDFARFIEDNLPDIVSPPGAELLEVAKTLEAKKSVNFASGVRLDNGQVQLVYEEEIRGSAAKGTLEIPSEFELGIPIYEGGPAYRIPVRLRYRIQDNKLLFWYDIVRPHRYIQDALNETRERIVEKTELKVWAGDAS